MKARHLISAHSGNVRPPRKKTRSVGHILQMKNCNEAGLPKVAKLPLFEHCSANEIKDLLGELRGVIRSFDAGEIILHECTPAVSMVVVVSGVVLVRECGLADDSRHLVQRLYAGGTFGATFPALATKTCPGMLVAEESSEVLLLNVAAIRRMMEEGRYPRFLADLYAAACVQGFYAWRKLMLLSCYEIGDRVLLYLKWRQEDGLSEPAKFKYGELAEYLGVNRTALYRAIAKLRKSGKIRIVADTLALA